MTNGAVPKPVRGGRLRCWETDRLPIAFIVGCIGASRADRQMLFGRELLTRVVGGRQRAIQTILIVEDEALVAFDNEHVMVQSGYDVVATVDGYDHAIAAMDAGGIDLVIADINLRGERSGVDVARYAHAVDIPVLFVSGTCPIDAQTLAVGCLAKPYSQRDLLLAIEVVDAVIRSARRPKLPAGMNVFSHAA